MNLADNTFIAILQSVAHATVRWIKGLDVVHSGVVVAVGSTPLIVPIILLIFTVFLFLPASPIGRILALPYLQLKKFLRLKGIIRDKRTWGVVFDSITKEPIDPAYVTVKTRIGTVVATAITDLDGRFGIIVHPGVYTLSVEKTNYTFPSTKLLGMDTDGYYTGLYFGGQFEIKRTERALAFAIPMDPLAADWNQTEKTRTNKTNKRKDYRSAGLIYFILAGILLATRYLVLRQDFALQLLGLYAVMLVIGTVYVASRSTSQYHSVVLDTKGLPVGFARVKVFDAATRMQVSSKTTSLNGQFVSLVPNGNYYVTIDRRDDKGGYMLVHTSQPFRVVNRSIKRRFVI